MRAEESNHLRIIKIKIEEMNKKLIKDKMEVYGIEEDIASKKETEMNEKISKKDEEIRSNPSMQVINQLNFFQPTMQLENRNAYPANTQTIIANNKMSRSSFKSKLKKQIMRADEQGSLVNF